MDLERLNDALERAGKGDRSHKQVDVLVFIAAARAYRDLLDNSSSVQSEQWVRAFNAGWKAAYRDLVNGERVEPDYEAAAEVAAETADADEREELSWLEWVTLLVDAAIGGKLLVDYPTEEE